jgi:CHRD domain-containing protein
MSGVLTMSCLLFLAGACKKSSAPGPGATASAYTGTLVKFTPGVVTAATGSVSANFSPSDNGLSYTFTWQGLSSRPNEMSICDVGVPIISISGFPTDTSGTFSGQATLSGTQVNDLTAGKLYLKIRTANYPDGEVVGYMTQAQSPGSNPGNGGGPQGSVIAYGATLGYSGSYQGYYPPSGSVSANFDTVSRKLSFSLNWIYLSGNPSGMNFSDGGSAFYTITGFSASTEGSVTGTDSLNAQQAADLATGKIAVQINTQASSPELSGTLTKK